MRKKIVTGNWKMNTTAQEANALAAEIVRRVASEVNDEVKIILCPPFPYLQEVTRHTKTAPSIAIGAQNCNEHLSGAYTGEVSVSMLQSLGVAYVIIGHSERRQYFQEQGSLLACKVNVVLASGLHPIYCCGEPLAIREAGQEKQFVNTQIEEALFHLDEEAIKRIVLAYEPVWAIGSNRTATPQQVQEMHTTIRGHLASKFGQTTSNRVSILYGGSVKASNAKEIFACSDVDGGLIGGASLQAEEFVKIVQSI